jgi:23S rRNA (guanine745-N1)-methyltransferase
VSLLACPVRGCGEPLAREGRSLVCARQHRFDIARSGYINLLQPQDRRSPNAGDTREAVEARTRLLASGVGRAALDAVVARAAALDIPDNAAVVDLGCGGGELLGALSACRPIAGIGVDLSTPAIDAAAKRYPHLTWVVANADRRVPVLDRSAALVLSLNGRRHPEEAARMLRPDGHLIVALPAADDLIELREVVHGAAVERVRSDAVIDAHAGRFTLVDRTTIRDTRTVTAEQAADLLLGTYRGRRSSQAARATDLREMEVTLSTEVLCFTSLERVLRRRQTP